MPFQIQTTSNHWRQTTTYISVKTHKNKLMKNKLLLKLHNTTRNSSDYNLNLYPSDKNDWHLMLSTQNKVLELINTKSASVNVFPTLIPAVVSKLSSLKRIIYISEPALSPCKVLRSSLQVAFHRDYKIHGSMQHNNWKQRFGNWPSICDDAWFQWHDLSLVACPS